MSAPDKYATLRPYLDLVLQPCTSISTNNGSHWELGSLWRHMGRDYTNNLLDDYFKEMGDNGQLDPHNKWNKP